MSTPAMQSIFGKSYKPPSRWKKFRRWLHEMDRRFLWKRIIIIFDSSRISMAEMDRLPFERMRINGIIVRMRNCDIAFAIYDADKLPRMKFEQLQKLMEDVIYKELHPLIERDFSK